MTVLSSQYGILINCAINALGKGNSVVDEINATDKRNTKESIEFIGKLASNYTSSIGMLPSASKDVFIKFSDQQIHIININHVYMMFNGTLVLIKEV